MSTCSFRVEAVDQVYRLRIVSYRVSSLWNKVWCAMSSRIGSVCRQVFGNKINSKLSNQKLLSSVIDVVDSHREAWYVVDSSVPVSRCRHCRLWSTLIDNVIVRWCRASLLTDIVVVCQHCSSTLSVIALADWRHRWPLLFRRVCFIDVACQVSGQSSCLSSSINGRP